MAHNPTHRPKLVLQDPLSISQTTTKRHSKPSNNTSTSTIYNLTNHFSRLHPNNPTKHLDTHLQTKALSKSLNLDPSKPSPFGQNNVGKLGKRVVFESGVKNKSLVGVKEEKKDYKKDLKKKVESDQFKKSSGVIANNSNSKLLVVKEAQPRFVVNNGISKRRSFCDVQVELANFLVTNCAKVVSADMPPFMQIHVVGFARKIKDSLEKFTSKNLALSLKKELDGVYGPAWHCIVGTSFGSFVTHSVGGFLYFSLDQKWYVLLFKTSVQRAD